MRRVMTLAFLMFLVFGLMALIIAPRRIDADAPPPRFWISDRSTLGDEFGSTAYLLHDNKQQGICWIVVESYRGGVTMTPRSCQS